MESPGELQVQLPGLQLNSAPIFFYIGVTSVDTQLAQNRTGRLKASGNKAGRVETSRARPSIGLGTAVDPATALELLRK
jgi:hypothetical protein